MHPVQVHSASTTARTVHANTNFTTPGAPQVFFGPGNFGPGMAFSSNLFNTTGDFGIKAAIDPVTQLRIATAEKLAQLRTPFAGFGYYLYDNAGYGTPVYDSSAEAVPPNPSQQPIIVVEQQAAPQTGPEAVHERAQETAPPLPDVGHFTLIMRNGSKIEAVAFSLVNGKLIYIAADGARHTLNAADLDIQSTKQVNEESGTSLRL